jgi:Domain of unknown function (DUF1830)
MTQLFDSIPTDCTQQILCCYFNSTKKIQILRLESIPNSKFERVVFPLERLLFEAPPDAQLEVYRSTQTGTSLSTRIACDRLRVN